MNKFTKIAHAAIAASILLFACNASDSNNTSGSSSCSYSSDNPAGLPVMDCRVVSYKMIYSNEKYNEYFKYGDRFITDQDALKSWFPDIFNNEQADSKCNYFAVYFGSSSTFIRYWILSQDMIVYQINPGSLEGCGGNTDVVIHVMLVCDDTEEGNLKDKINLDNIQPFTDENWDCREEEKNVFF